MKLTCYLALVVLLLLLSTQTGMAQKTIASDSISRQFGGPGSVTDQLADDERQKETLTGLSTMKRYFDWKKRLKKDHGLSLSFDYNSGLLVATNTLNDDDLFASGAVRFFGYWALVGRGSGNTGSIVWKVENRHTYTNLPANAAASEIGYIGAILPKFNNIGTRLTNLYWKQKLNKGRMEIVAGFLDATDWVDLYAFASPWNGFFNFAFSTGGGSIALPDAAAIGTYVNAMITDNLYVIGGLTDANANSKDPFGGFETFFKDHEYFKSIELGWTTDQKRFYFDNTHLTFWHADERTNDNISSGWGLNFSFAQAFNDKWMPFIRAGYADEGGSLLQKTVSTGLGYHLKDDISLLGFGFNWGQPNVGTFGQGLDDQYSFELFGRLQITQNLQVTPDIEWIINPALNPKADQSWIVGLRARLVL